MRNRELRFQRILCAVDFSAASLRALDLAIELAVLHGARIHILHVIPRIVASILDIPITTSRWTAKQEDKAKRELPRLTERAESRGVPAQAEVRIGDIDVQILKTAADIGADLLAMGTHGRRGFERWAMGSVAERMLRHSPIPLLLTAFSRNAAGSMAIRRILIPTDFSGGTGEAIQYGLTISAKTGASITLLHVINDRSAVVDWKESPDQTAAIQERLEALIPPPARGAQKVLSLVESGEPYRVILKAIKDSKASLVIINTHGHGFVHRVLIGNTADRVARGGVAMCPMLLIPPAPATSRGRKK